MFASVSGFMVLRHINSANAASTITVNSVADTGDNQLISLALGLLLIGAPAGFLYVNRWRESHPGR